jgi:hypothetical protein
MDHGSRKGEAVDQFRDYTYCRADCQQNVTSLERGVRAPILVVN